MSLRAAFTASPNVSPREIGNIHGIQPGKPFSSSTTGTVTLNEMWTAAVALI